MSTAALALESGGNLAALVTAANASVPAGSAIIGKFGIDQTTPGTTNLVQIGGTVPLPTGASNAVAQGSTTAGETGDLIQVAVVNAQASYTAAKTNPLTLNQFGHLRVTNGTLDLQYFPTVTASSAYAANQVIGQVTVVSFTIPEAIIQAISVTSGGANASGLITAYVFSANPTSSTFTDKTTAAINISDRAKVLGAVPLGAGDTGLGTHTVWGATNVGLVVQSSVFYVLLVCKAALTTSAYTNDISLHLTLKL